MAAAKHRVLFLAQRLGPGGVVTHMRTLAQELQKRDWAVAIASQGKVGEHAHGADWFEAMGVRHYLTPFPSAKPTGANVRAFCQTWRSLQRTVAEFGPDLLHVHWRLNSPFARMLQVRRGLPFVSTLHTSGTAAGWPQRALSFWGCRAIAVSAETRDELVQGFHVREDRVRTIHYGVDEARFHPPTAQERLDAKSALGLPAGRLVVALIGSGHRRKGHDLLFAALRALDRQPRLLALLAGDDAEKSALAALATQYGVAEDVKTLGFADSRQVLWAADILVLPSRKEGLPIAVIEAMLCGLPVVRTPTAGCRDQTRDGVDGLVIPFDDAIALADGLRKLATDPSLRARMGAEAARSAKERFTTALMAGRIVSLYEEVLAEKTLPR